MPKKPKFNITVVLQVECWQSDICIVSDQIEDAIEDCLQKDAAKLIGDISVNADRALRP